MVAKVAGGVIGLGLLGTGGIAFAKPEWLGMDYMPEFQDLSTDSDYGTTYTEDDHFGKKYGKYLVGVTGENNKTNKNQKFWEWAFRQMSKEIEKSKFSTQGQGAKIEKGFSDVDNSKTLNQVCKAAYKTKESEMKDDSDQSSNDKFKKSEVWKYCSPVGQKPTTVKEFDNKAGQDPVYTTVGTGNKKQIGKEAESELISVNDDNNQIFWNIRDKEFKARNLDANNHKFFKKQKDANNRIKDICAIAYKQTKQSNEVSSEDKATTTETKKFCSLTISAS